MAPFFTCDLPGRIADGEICCLYKDPWIPESTASNKNAAHSALIKPFKKLSWLNTISTTENRDVN
tara:strand:- start:109 stop:303 length:195 start_codon:yes stop_codon:yes gene_type:complete